MVNPNRPPTIVGSTDAELEEFLLFCIAVAGKNARITAHGLDRLLGWLPVVRPDRLPLLSIYEFCKGDRYAYLGQLADLIRLAGLGCYRQRAASFVDLAWMVHDTHDLDIRTCSLKELEQVRGIGKKTSRFYMVYTRPGNENRYAILDTHILSWLSEQGHKGIPDKTPRGARYNEIESIFLAEASSLGLSARELDEQIWKARRVETWIKIPKEIVQ